MEPTELNRRDVLKSLAAMTAALMVPVGRAAAQATQPAAGPGSKTTMADGAATTQPATRDRYGDLLPQRKLGRTGAMVTMLGIGGSHVGRIRDEAAAQKLIETAIEGGVRFFDSAVVYQNGGSESRLGRLLTPKYRDVAFLMTKTQAATAAEARKQLDDSLKRLNTDYLDLWQMHEYMSAEMVDTRLKGGVLEVFLEAQQKGKVRYIGFTGHATPQSHLRMLEHMKEKGDPLQTCQMPINVADPSFNSFILQVLPALVQRGYGVCAMKTLAGSGFTNRGAVRVVPNLISVEECLQFVWSLPVSTLISGPDNAEQFAQTISYAKRFKALDDEARKGLIAKVAGVAGRGVEYYKV
jgi:predicted aldo/keto reductase-like oxidoreductase